MDVKFITVAKSNVSSVPVVDGQVIALQDRNGLYYDMNSVRRNVRGVSVVKDLKQVGDPDCLYALFNHGSKDGIYAWNDEAKRYEIIASKDTDKYITLMKSADLQKVYLTGSDGSNYWYLFWNENVYADLKNGTISAVQFNGKATSAAKADLATKAESVDRASEADVADKLGTSTVGDAFTAIYLLNGVATRCSHSVKCDVPENAKFTDTTYAVFTGATAKASGTQGLVPAPQSSDSSKFLRGDGTWSYVESSDMVGCSATADGKHGFAPAPVRGSQNKFLRANGSWDSYKAGHGLELVSLTFNLTETGVKAGTYGPVENADNFTTFEGKYIQVPRITVDKYGRVTDVTEVPCKVSTVASGATYMKFSMTPDNERLLCTYEDEDTALAKFNLTNEGHLTATYQYEDDELPATVEIDENGHVVAKVKEE